MIIMQLSIVNSTVEIPYRFIGTDTVLYRTVSFLEVSIPSQHTPIIFVADIFSSSFRSCYAMYVKCKMICKLHINVIVMGLWY